MSEITPINWDDKVNSPELLAFLQQFGEKYYLSADEINELRDKTNSLIVNRPTDISLKLDRGGYPGTAQDIVDSIHDPVDISGKLDKGGYTGTAKTLKEELELSSKIYTDEESQAVRNYTDTELSFKENIVNKAVDFNTINDILFPTVKSVKTQLDTRIPLTEKGIANGVASLGADGKIPNSQIPALAISETFPINSQVAMLALSQADQGDVAVRLDLNKSFILRVAPSSVLENWQELLTPSDSVQSVNGQVGNVNLTTSDIQDSANKRYQTDNQKLFNDATSSIQTQLNGKQPNLGFTPEQAFSKNTAFNKNFGTTGGTVAEGNDVRINNGQTAFSWGNHAGLYVPIAGNAVSASKWLTARTFTVGNSSKTVDGTANVSWSLSEIGAQPLLTNPITGVVGTNYIPKSNGSGLINSVISETAGNVSISGRTAIAGSFSAESGEQVDTPTPASAGAFLKGVDVGTAFGQFGSSGNYASWMQSMRRDGTYFGLVINPSGGNVGIGIGSNTAQKTLEVNGVIRANTHLMAGRDNVVGDRFIVLESSTDGSIPSINSYLAGTGTNDIAINPNGGSVLIGTRTGNGLGVLQVNGNVTATTFIGDLNGTANRATTSDSLIDYVGGNRIFWGWNGVKLTARVNGSDFGESIPINITGNAQSATMWGSQQYIGETEIADPRFIMTYDNSVNKWKPALPSAVQALLGVNNGSTLSNNITGNANSANSAINWELYDSSGANTTVDTYLMGWYNGKWRPTTAGAIKGYLGLGSNAFSSQAYLPLTGGSISGNLGVNGTLGVVGVLSSGTNIATPLLTLQGGGAPYIQFLNESGTRRAYIQHDGANLNIQADIGNVVLNSQLLVNGGIMANEAVRVKANAPYYEFLNPSQAQMGYIQHNGSGIQIVTGGGALSVSNALSVSGTITASGGFFNSDERLKDVVKRDGDVAYFTWKDKRDKKTHIGYIAQEVQKRNPDQVQADEKGFLSVNYVELLVAEIQNLKNEIKVMKGGCNGIC